MEHRAHRWRAAAVVLAAAGLLALGLGAPGASAAEEPRIDLKVLVVDNSENGDSPVEAITAQLRSTGVPYTTVDLNDASRATITDDFLSDTVNGAPRAKYQGVVLPNEAPFGSGSAEQTALETYEKTFGIPQVDAYTWAHPEVGLDYSSYSGTLDGHEADITDTGKAGYFGYLDGPFTFEDTSSSVQESYGFVATPRTGFTSYVDTAVPGGSGRGSLIGEYAHDGRRELVLTFAYNQYQEQFRVLARGIVEWLTQGVHLGQARNYFAVHVDDVFAPDSRWDTERNCTPGDFDCVGGDGEGTTPIRMTAADAVYAAQWEQDHGFTLDMVFNAGSGEEWKEENGGTDALTDQLLADKAKFRWVNHTYTHQFLGCVQDTTTVPWTCAKNADGSTQYMSTADISAEISNNYNWALTHGLSTDRSELVTGEHSGLKVLPQQPDDNPNLAAGLAANGVEWTASDNSREPEQRSAGGSTLTVPRYPMNVYYNVGTKAEMADEYNWIYTSSADGGSGVCENNPTSTCLDGPLDTATGYDSYIVPQEAHTALGHALGNDPRPHYAHQSNLSEDRILYPVLDRVLTDYQALFADNTPLENLRQSAIGTELQRRTAWQSAVAGGQVTAYRIGNTVTVTAPSGTQIPVTAPEGTTKQLLLGTTAFGTPYAGERSAWTTPELLQDALMLNLPSS